MHIPYENGGGTGAKWGNSLTRSMLEYNKRLSMLMSQSVDDFLIRMEKDRPEDPIEEVIQETEAWWEKNDLYISGDRRDE